MTKQVKSRERVAEHGEVFTAEREVNAMLDLVKQETERVDSRFLEPACGDGNFVVEILRRKLEAAKKRAIPPRKKKPLPLEFEKQSVIAVASIYGVDLLIDNVIACRQRLYDIWNAEYENICKKEVSEDCATSAITSIIEQQAFMDEMANIVPIGEGRVQIIEIPITAADPAAQKQIWEINLPKEVIVGCILRGDKTIIPRGDTRIIEGDDLVLLSGNNKKSAVIKELKGGDTEWPD